MLIFVEQISERLLFTLDFVFNEHGMAYRLTNDTNEFLAASENKLNYSNFPFEQAVTTLDPSTFLFEESFDKNTRVVASTWHNEPCLEINFVSDPLAAIFYVLSRYEEYGEQIRDQHDRFPAKRSVLVKNNWLQEQIVERWTWAFFSAFSPELLQSWDRKVVAIPTFDIDNTYAFQWKEGWRTWLSVGKDSVARNQERKELRKQVQTGQIPDPFDCFEAICGVQQAFPETRVFWHVGDYGKYDTNISSFDPRHQQLIRFMDSANQVGLHPSYKSNQSSTILNEEKQRLEQILGHDIRESRQHFLKLHFPATYQKNIAAGLKRDYTLGYAEQVGFRAGTARPHAFFNVQTNCYCRDYYIVPFCYMDGTLLEYQKYTIEEAKQIISRLFQEITRYGGVFSFIWHNETYAEAGKWKGWREVFNYSLEIYEAHITS